MKRSGQWLMLWFAALLVALPQAVAAAQEGPTMVILVRHGEKANVPGNDPPLSEAGQARAAALAQALSHAPVTAIITSTLQRTVQTASGVAAARKLDAEKIGLEGGAAAHVAAVAAAVRAKQGVVLVVGHSNTIPAIVHALGGPKLPDICDASYATMYVMRPATSQAPVTVAQFGAADPAGATSCPGMQAR